MDLRKRESVPRTAALLALGALALHQLRYLVATGGHPGETLATQGHGYMSGALPVLAAFVVAALSAGLLRALAGHEPGAPSRLHRRTFGLAVTLFAVFAVQESLEGLLAAGHTTGLGAVLAAGGWTALPLALVVGAACALTERRLVSLERRVAIAVRAGRTPRLRPRRRDPRPLAVVLGPSVSPLAFGTASRPPPALPLTR